MKTYRIHKTTQPYPENGDRESFWTPAEIAPLDHFPWYVSGPKWRAYAQLLYDAEHLYARMVTRDDPEIIAVHTAPNQPVCEDSCAEFFIQPGIGEGVGYFNVEINCVGTMLLAYGHGRHGRVYVDQALASQVAIQHTVPGPTKQASPSDNRWAIEAVIPYRIMQQVVDFSSPEPGTVWRGNFYRCADAASHPQWNTWNRVGTENPDYHQPGYFGRLAFV